MSTNLFVTKCLGQIMNCHQIPLHLFSSQSLGISGFCSLSSFASFWLCTQLDLPSLETNLIVMAPYADILKCKPISRHPNYLQQVEKGEKNVIYFSFYKWRTWKARQEKISTAAVISFESPIHCNCFHFLN